MSPLYLHNGKLLINNSKLASNEACCCQPCFCLIDPCWEGGESGEGDYSGDWGRFSNCDVTVTYDGHNVPWANLTSGGGYWYWQTNGWITDNLGIPWIAFWNWSSTSDNCYPYKLKVFFWQYVNSTANCGEPPSDPGIQICGTGCPNWVSEIGGCVLYLRDNILSRFTENSRWVMIPQGDGMLGEPGEDHWSDRTRWEFLFTCNNDGSINTEPVSSNFISGLGGIEESSISQNPPTISIDCGTC